MINRYVQYRDVSSPLKSRGQHPRFNTSTVHRISHFLTSCFHGQPRGPGGPQAQGKLAGGWASARPPRGTGAEGIKCSSPRDWPWIRGSWGERPRTKYVFGVCAQQAHSCSSMDRLNRLHGLEDPADGFKTKGQRTRRLRLNTAFKTIQDPKKLLGEKKMFRRKNIWSQISLYLRKKYICNIYIYIYI